jgi:hypothetical protein
LEDFMRHAISLPVCASSVSAARCVRGRSLVVALTDVVTVSEAVSAATLLAGEGDGTLAEPGTPVTAPHSSGDLVAANLDGNGTTELLVPDAFNDIVSVVLGQPRGDLVLHGTFATGEYPVDVAVGKFNGDAIPDIATATEEPLLHGRLSCFAAAPCPCASSR